MSSKNWKLLPRDGYGALYSGINNLRKTFTVHHVGLVGNIVDDDGVPVNPDLLSEGLKKELKSLLLPRGCVPVFVGSKDTAGHYDGYCKTVIQPLLHYIVWDTDYTGEDQKNFAQYNAVNDAVAVAVHETYHAGDLIWIHDYHLMSCPKMVRERLPSATIGFFLHAPFPSSEIFRCLPRRKELIEGVLGADLVGFQVYSYARHFLSSATRLLSLESSPKGVEYHGRPVITGIFPIGVDVEATQALRDSVAVQKRIVALRELYKGRKVIVGRDKRNQINGIQHKFNAFEKFLELYPDWWKEVVLIQVASPPEHEAHRLETKITETASRINSRFGSLEYTPVQLIQQHIDVDEYYALLSIADAGLITSVRDGMNTTSHEFIISQKDNHGPLILSEFTGTAGSMGSAILVNPWDTNGVAKAIDTALTMGADEKKAKYKQLDNSVKLQSSKLWANSFITELQNAATQLGHGNEIASVPVLDKSTLVESFKRSHNRVLIFDYDGTLTPIVRVPSAALPPPKMLSALNKLTEDPRNYCFVVSGRDQKTLEEWLGSIHGLGLSAEHGAFIRYPNNENWEDVLEDADFSWKEDVLKIFNHFCERTQGANVEEKRTSVTWHYRQADPEWGWFQMKELKNHLESSIVSRRPLEVLVGKKNLEVRPIIVNKGYIVKRLVDHEEACDFVICAGDDKTDEDMFKVLRKAEFSTEVPQESIFTVVIGDSDKTSGAAARLKSPLELIDLLLELADLPPADGVGTASL
ncbi:glycosyltransferase family 20 protein [Gonapodya prolifera JEL478]|uniref:Glycosyltransferase family 20 protein n=1 Tax=Gonapodya prolifera (strain JEL478) TaxID=1344416 RepID=A0A139AJY8_GONPJ|nr:glycosyltransferase family 20 protein [Gonapodya prolifera JEL478]|eukprot:KXS17097.1 glycosyltransferase family 20 protein [Gonapodya prolifera JEL478]